MSTAGAISNLAAGRTQFRRPVQLQKQAGGLLRLEGAVPPATSVQPEVTGALLAAMKSASIVDEHRALMGAVIEKIQSAESGLNESYISLMRGFEVCFMRFRRVS